jgi:hypothetical protein
MPTSTWTDIVSDVQAEGYQITKDFINQVAQNTDFLRNPPSDIYSPSTAASNITTTSTTPVLLTGFQLSLTTQGGKIFVFFCLRGNTTNARFDIYLDGVSVTGDSDYMGAVAPASTFGMNTAIRILAASAGAHTLDLYWKVTASTGTIYPAGLCQFAAWEIGNIS